MGIARVFVGWQRPTLPAAADYLRERFAAPGRLDMENVVLVLPGARAARRMLEILVDEAAQRRLRLCPPRLVTVGHFPELLYRAKRPFAGDLVQELAWVEALRHSGPRAGALISALPADGDLLSWLAMGRMLRLLHRELAAEALDFADVARRGQEIPGFHEAARWETLAEVQDRYLHVLDGLDLWDLQTARLYAIEHGECQTGAELVLVGAADLNRSQRQMLDQVAPRATAVVFAPLDLADRFDEFGCVRPPAWLGQQIAVSADQIQVVESPEDQVEAAVRAIAGWAGRYNTEQIAVGVPDEQLVPYLLQSFGRCGLAARYGAGVPVLRSLPCRLLSSAAEYLRTDQFAAFSGLVRHPAVHDWLAKHGVPGDWLSAIDRYYADRLPHTLADLAKPADPDATQSNDPARTVVAETHRAVESLCGSLRGPPRALGEWSGPIAQFLLSAFGRSPLDRRQEPDRTTLAACETIREVLEEHAAVPGGLAPSLSGPEALDLVLRQVAGGRVPAPPDRGAAELLGWLELPFDDAPALVVTGFNEGRVPSAINADLFLPNQLRRILAIEDNDRRYARDAYALSLLAASREQLRLIAGRRTAEADPLLPSRLLFACDEAAMAERVLAYFSGGPPRGKGDSPLLCEGTVPFSPPDLPASRLEVPRPKPLAEPILSMRVTEFKDYLECPYRYYLKHVLKLETLGDRADELDGAAFGSLAHEVLRAFGQGPAADAADEKLICGQLDRLLDRAARAHYGRRPLPSILVQIEQLRGRLRALGRWQAQWASEGWRIEHVEVGPKGAEAALVVDGRPMILRGRMDRIDVHPEKGRMIFDYKFSDRARTPDQTHRRKGDWIDLQLPLYRHLATALGLEGPVQLAYLVVPKDLGNTGHKPAGWTEEELHTADDSAAEVVRRVRAEQFWPPAAPPPAFSEQFAAICQDGRFGAAAAAGEEEITD
jgi:RecB family exonuclease